MGATTDPTAGGSVISLPSGGGSIGGLGETFSPDLFTGTGNFSVPIEVPPGRLGMAPQLALGYSTGHGNGPWGLGWQLSLPGVSRKTAKGVPRYADVPGSDPLDVFVLSGAEDLVPVSGSYPGRVRYRPRTEGMFARVEHVRDASGDFWEVRTRDGLRTRYGTPRPANAPAGWQDPAAVADPHRPDHVAGWRVTETRDPHGNVVRYDYLADRGDEPGHTWNQPLVARISYADYGDPAAPSFLVQVRFDYEPRPDPFSTYRSGFEIRTTQRCRTIRVVTQAADGVSRVACEYRFSYETAAFNGASLLTRVDVVGIDGTAEEATPPLRFAYSAFDPAGRRFQPVTGPGLPPQGLNDKTLALVDLRGVGLPDVVELGAAHRFWRNAGDGRLELPRSLAEAPPFSLDNKDIRFLDANGDGRPDLVVSGATAAGETGYFPMAFASGWSRRFRAYAQSPSVGLADPAVKLVDLDGDGLTDVLQSGTRLTAFFNDRDPHRAWRRTAVASALPDVDLTDPHVHLADVTGDGLTDVVLVRSGSVVYWPNLGHGRWGTRVAMRRSPRLPDGHDPRRLLLGDIDGDGCADLVYVDNGRVLLWGNQSGTSWTAQPTVVPGTPSIVDTDAVQLSDLLGTGMAGLLYSGAADGSGRPRLRFLDVTGGAKPYLLSSVDNGIGATTLIRYGSSTQEYLRDQADPNTRWRTTLPFPTQVVTYVEIVDAISHGRMTTEYRYHHGYWDGEDREFRGFARVDQLDTETFPGPLLESGPLPEGFSPPTLTKHWFHPGPVAADDVGDWTELDLRHEYWSGDQPMLTRPPEMTAFLAGLSRSARRSALRALRGQPLRTELYALDGTDRQDRPYTVTEGLPGVREEQPPGPGQPERERIFLPLALAQRATDWERGTDPMTRFSFSAGFDAYGFATKRLAVAVPRGRDPRVADASATSPYLATLVTTEFARRDDDTVYIVDRTSRGSTYEVVNDGRSSVADLQRTVLSQPIDTVLSQPAGSASLRLVGHTRNFYDGPAFIGGPLGVLGDHGLESRSESLVMTDVFIAGLGRPAYLDPSGATPFPAEYPPEFRAQLPHLAGYVHYTDADVPGSPGGYYGTSSRHRYDSRGMPVEWLDALGASTRVEYDVHDLLPVTSVDVVGLTTAAVYDYRVLKARDLTDANGNTTSVTFSPLALVTARFVRGKNGEGDGDLPSARMTYDLMAFAERGQPRSVRTDRRVHHDTDTGVPAEQRDAVLTTVELSDGFGRLVQTRALAEDTLFGDPTSGGEVISGEDLVPAGDSVGRTRGPADPDNVLVSGLVVYDNKGRPVQKYEPYFDTGFAYAPPRDNQLGQRTTTFYDPRGKAVRTVHADGSAELVVLGVPVDLTNPDVFTPTPWITYSYDANDNAGRTHGEAAARYRGHWNTPTSVEIDALGRAVTSVTRNGPADHPETWFTTRSRYDIQGNLVAVTDALGRQAFQYTYDLAKRRWRTDSIDAGRHDTVLDPLGHPVESRDGKGALTLGGFDALHRPALVWARDDAAGQVTLRQRIQIHQRFEADPDKVFGSTIYLRELCDFAQRSIAIGTGPGPDRAALTARFLQPFDRLPEPDADAVAKEPVAQARVAVEVLRRNLSTPAPADLDQRLRAFAYESLLRALGTSGEELRLARGASRAERTALAARLGFDLEATRPDRLDRLTVSPDVVTDAQLENLFGFRSLLRTDPFVATTALPELLADRQATLRSHWQVEDALERDAVSGGLAVIDPDHVAKANLAAQQATDPVLMLWTQRQSFLANLVTQIDQALRQGGGSVATFDQQVTAQIGTFDLAGLAARDANGEDVRGDLPPQLDVAGLRFLAGTRALLVAQGLVNAEWAEVRDVLVGVRKRRETPHWRTEEVAAGVVLQPQQFLLDPPPTDVGIPDPGPSRWRVGPSVHSDWSHTLAVRAAKADALQQSQRDLLATVEAEVVPAARDELLALVGSRQTPVESGPQTAARLSKELCIDFLAESAQLTTRADQAAETLLTALFSLRSGRLAVSTGGQAWTIPNELDFDGVFAWLGSFQTWYAAITSFAYPENHLFPTLYLANELDLHPTAVYGDFLKDLRAERVTPQRASQIAVANRGRLAGLATAPVKDLVNGFAPVQDVHTTKDLDNLRTEVAKLFGVNPAQDQQLREAFYLVPVALAEALQEGGHFKAALDWYQYAYAYQLPAGKRRIFPGLVTEATITSSFDRPGNDWPVRGSNPHEVALHRANAYTRFTVMSVVRCLLAFAETELVRNTTVSNARARALYDTALELVGSPDAAPLVGPGIPFPANPVWVALSSQAAVGLDKIHSGLNITGAQVGADDTDSTLPSQYRFSVLIDRAKNLVTTAAQLESAFLNAVQQRDSAAYTELQAGRDLAVAQAMIGEEDLKVTAASLGIDLASKQVDKARFQAGHFGELVTRGLNGSEQDELFQKELARDAGAASSILSTAFSAASGSSSRTWPPRTPKPRACRSPWRPRSSRSPSPTGR